MSDTKDELRDRVAALKRAKREAKELKRRTKDHDFHNQVSDGSTGSQKNQSGKRTKKRKKGMWQRKEQAILPHVSLEGMDTAEQEAAQAMPPPPPAANPMTHFADDMHKHRSESLRAQSGQTQADPYAIVARDEQYGLEGRGETPSATNLARFLQQANVRDRWFSETGTNLTDKEKDNVQDFVQSWVREGVPRLPAEYRARADLFQMGSDDRRARVQEMGEPVSRAYLQSFLRTPHRNAGERPCAAGCACQGEQMFARSWIHNTNDKNLHQASKVMREFLTPRELTKFQQRGELPKLRNMCLVCERFIVSMLVKYRSVHNGDATTAEYAGQLGRHTVMVDQEGEYSSTATLFSESPISGITRRYLAHADNRYIYVMKSREGQPYVALEEINVQYEDSLN